VHARALREQVDWDALAARVAESPFARAFLALARDLDIAPPARQVRTSLRSTA
jgi:hypothetical protein